MDIRILVGTEERSQNTFTPRWLNENLKKRRADGASICVRILIDHEDIHLALATSNCPNKQGRGRELTHQENEIVGWWRKLHLDGEEFSTGNIIAFLKRLGV